MREDHWLIDFGIGRDFGLGNSHAEWTLGIRVADLRSRLNTNATTAGQISGTTSVVTHGINVAQQRSTFVGAGPRFGVQGDIPLGGQWSIDWLAGAAVLFGERNVQVTSITNSTVLGVTHVTTTTLAHASDSPAIFNVDAQAGLSYWFSPNLKFTVSYRFDEYFRALKNTTVASTVLGTGGPILVTSNIDRSFSGPMARVTWKY